MMAMDSAVPTTSHTPVFHKGALSTVVAYRRGALRHKRASTVGWPLDSDRHAAPLIELRQLERCHL